MTSKGLAVNCRYSLLSVYQLKRPIAGRNDYGYEDSDDGSARYAPLGVHLTLISSHGLSCSVRAAKRLVLPHVAGGMQSQTQRTLTWRIEPSHACKTLGVGFTFHYTSPACGTASWVTSILLIDAISSAYRLHRPAAIMRL